MPGSSWSGKCGRALSRSSVACKAILSHALCSWWTSVLWSVCPLIQTASSGQFSGRFAIAWKNRFHSPLAGVLHRRRAVVGGFRDPSTTDWLSRRQKTGTSCAAFSAAVTKASSSDLYTDCFPATLILLRDLYAFCTGSKEQPVESLSGVWGRCLPDPSETHTCGMTMFESPTSV